MLDGALWVVYITALAVAAVGIYAVVSSPSPFAVDANRWGVPHWMPTGMALLLALAGVLTWARDTVFRALAVHWAVGAAAFARVGLLGVGVDVRLEYATLLTAGLLAAVAVVYAPPSSVRLALYSASAATLLAFVAMRVPSTVSPLYVDFPVCTLIFALVTLTLRASWIHHSTPTVRRPR